MISKIGDKTRLLVILTLLLGGGFVGSSLFGFHVAREAIRESITRTELPLTSDNVYSVIQKDLVQPILISSMMARDTFLRDWVLAGERDAGQMTRFLAEIKARHGTVSSFFVSERSRRYYAANGILKTVRRDEGRDAWYFRVSQLSDDYEINVDLDMANADALTIFVNYRVTDYANRFIGVAGVGQTVEHVSRLIDDYQRRFGRTIVLVDGNGTVKLAGSANGDRPARLADIPGLAPLAGELLRTDNASFAYSTGDRRYLLNARLLPELKWHLLVIKSESDALEPLQRSLEINLALCLAVTAIVLGIVLLTVNRYQTRLERLAVTDPLTGLANRHALDLLLEQQTLEATRYASPLAAILLDLDHFKAINDRRGHLAGDAVLQTVARNLKEGLRSSDIACRWGGEEFLVVLPDTPLDAAARVAQQLRERIAALAPDADEPATITASAGVAQFRPPESRETFLARLDALLYQAKREGRDRLCCAEADPAGIAPESDPAAQARRSRVS